METILSIIGYTLLTVVGIILFLCLMVGLKLLVWFNFRLCKHCGHTLKYKGLKEDNENGHYLFHCHHCGAWEQIPKSTFLKNFIYKDYDPYNL